MWFVKYQDNSLCWFFIITKRSPLIYSFSSKLWQIIQFKDISDFQFIKNGWICFYDDFVDFENITNLLLKDLLKTIKNTNYHLQINSEDGWVLIYENICYFYNLSQEIMDVFNSHLIINGFLII